jgi:hypothetical protein
MKEVPKKKTPLSVSSVGYTKASSVPSLASQSEITRSIKVQFDFLSDDKKPANANSKLAARKATPNFKRLHDRQFETSKSITSIVERVRV